MGVRGRGYSHAIANIGEIERTQTNLMHFKWELNWTHGTQPNTFSMGHRVNSHFVKVNVTSSLPKYVWTSIFLHDFPLTKFFTCTSSIFHTFTLHVYNDEGYQKVTAIEYFVEWCSLPHKMQNLILGMKNYCLQITEYQCHFVVNWMFATAALSQKKNQILTHIDLECCSIIFCIGKRLPLKTPNRVIIDKNWLWPNKNNKEVVNDFMAFPWCHGKSQKRKFQLSK